MPRMANHDPLTSDPTYSNRIRVGWMWDLAAIFLVAGLLRAYVISQTPVISRDGMLYVGIARMINHDMWLDLVGDWFLFNPYPALIAWLARCGLSFDFSGQLISGVASTLAVVPLYLWCRRAFDPRIAQLAALTYALHPVILRFSGHVLREGLYWFLMLWGVQAFWEAARTRSWWRYIIAGLVTTAATLTRMEAAVVFILGAMWSVSLPAQASGGHQPADASSLQRFRPAFRIALSWSMFPITIFVLNLIFIPAGHGWHGCGRWVYMAARMIQGTEVATEAPKVAHRMRFFVKDEHARRAGQAPRPEDVRELAKSLPAWNPLGDPDPGQLRLQRFLILADDQRGFLFLGRFLNECWDGLLFPCLICCGYGLSVARKLNWWPGRDWPLVILSALLSAMLMYHLATEYILEPRYMLCLIPLVFPWSAMGARAIYHRLRVWFAARPAWSRWCPSAPDLCAVLVVMSVAKLGLGLEDRSKLVQKELGQKLRESKSYRLKIAGPESLKRVAHYAEADYFIIPRGVEPDEARQWLDIQPVDYVLLTPDEVAEIAPGTHPFSEDTRRYQPWPAQIKLGQIQVFSVDWKLRLMGD